MYGMGRLPVCIYRGRGGVGVARVGETVMSAMSLFAGGGYSLFVCWWWLQLCVVLVAGGIVVVVFLFAVVGLLVSSPSLR